MKKKIIIFSIAVVVIIVVVCFWVVAAVKTLSPLATTQDKLVFTESVERAPALLTESMIIDQAVPDTNFAREKIIKEGSLRLQTDNVKESSQEIHDLVEQFDAYIQSSTFEERDEIQVARFSLRIQSGQFDEFISSLSRIGQVKRSDVSTQDVTEEYIDLQSRFLVLRAQEERLLQMYAQAENIEEFLMLERELVRLRENIERTQGRLNYLERATSYSYIQVFLEQRKIATPQPENVIEDFYFSFREGWRIFSAAAVSIINSFLRAWPFIFIIAVIGAVIWRKRQFLKKERPRHDHQDQLPEKRTSD